MSVIGEVFKRQEQTALKWRIAPIKERKDRLKKIHHWILQNQSKICEAVHADFKKPHEEVLANDIFPVTSEINHILTHLDEWVKPKKVDAPLTLLGTFSEVRYEPRGVCLIISPWNFPFNLAIGPLAGALAAGNTAILKPSETTPSTSALIKAMIEELFRPEEVAVFEGGPDVSTELLSFPFHHIFFTGSPAIGKIVMRAAAEHLSSVTLELGGKSPAIVHEDAALFQSAQRIAFSKYLNNGQTCIAPDYVLVHEKVRDKFLDYLKKETLRLFGDREKIGSNSSAYGRIANDRNFLRLSKILDDAKSNGWVVELEGERDEKSRFFHPTILSHQKSFGEHLGRALEEEIFGPILPILTYSNIDNMVMEINRLHKPLALYIFSESSHIRTQVSQSTSSGGVVMNGCLVQFIHPNLPFGGVNNSGNGKGHGFYGFRSFSNEKAVVRMMSSYSSTSLFHPPYKGWFKKLMAALLRWF